ncbi:MAG TPA: hypothetical protein VK976_18395 [Verrucomicrobiae bacterium]|jgi:hypothetical protein|nr:hypothetical protein [Verrucomicrobiae bacterium]
MKTTLQLSLAFFLLAGGLSLTAAAQDGTINTLSLNPRQNVEMTNSAGTETGQPNDFVDESAAEGSSAPINSLSVNPRQNIEMTHATGTESGQPDDAVAGSDRQENGLVPVTSNMTGSGSNGNLAPGTASAKPPVASAPPAPANPKR